MATDRLASLRAWYARSTPEDRDAGARWYAEAYECAQWIASQSGHSVDAVVGVIAALSPRCTWQINTRIAYEVCIAHARGDAIPDVSTRTHRKKAWRLLDGAIPETVFKGSRGRGRKIANFRANILGDVEAVTLDTWSMRALGLTDTEAKLDGDAPRRYHAHTETYRTVARELNLAPSVLQAIVWLAIRRLWEEKPSA